MIYKVDISVCYHKKEGRIWKPDVVLVQVAGEEHKIGQIWEAASVEYNIQHPKDSIVAIGLIGYEATEEENWELEEMLETALSGSGDEDDE
jgi:hypothetical protein